VHRRTAAFLAEYAERGQDSRSRLPLTGLAARALAAAVRRGDREAAEAVWQAWLRHPDDQTWDLLCRPRGEQAMTEAVFAAATDPARPAASRAALGAFCARRGLVPAAGAGRVLFYLLSGQPAQRRAADPDGSVLAVAYRAADEPLRAAVREAVAGDGGLDLIRAVAASSGDDLPAAEAERTYLAAELARSRDWPRLWRLTLDLPLAEAVAAAQRLSPDWQPADEPDRRLRTRLAGADPAAIATLAAAEPVIHRDGSGASAWDLPADVCDCEFAPDGSGVAFVSTRDGSARRHRGWQPGGRAVLCALPGGRELNVLSDTGPLAHLGPAVVYVQRSVLDGDLHLIRLVSGHAAEDLGPPGSDQPILYLVPVPDGFVVAGTDRLWHGTAVPGAPLRDVTPPVLVEDQGQNGQTYDIGHVAAEPGTGQFAIFIRWVSATGSFSRPRHPGYEVLLLSPDFEITGRFPGDGITEMAFCGPDRLITRHMYEGLWSRRVTSPEVVDARFKQHHTHWWPVQPVPWAGVVIFDRDCLDAATLQPVPWPASLDWAREMRGLRVISPDGSCIAARDLNHDVEVRDLWQQEVGELLRHPMARSRLADLAALARLTDDFPARQAAATLGLLRACLEHRFRTEVAIGAEPARTPDDIALAPQDGPTGG
jgi:hypothetical protein